MGLISKIFGKSKVVEKTLDLGDKAFYTKQEQAETDLEVKKLLTASKGASLAIRIGFWLTIGCYLFSYLISVFCILFNKNILAQNISNLLNSFNLYSITIAFVSFYTGKKIIGGFNANKTMEKLTNLEKVKMENKKIEANKKEEESEFYLKLKTQLSKHEGLKLKPYRCSAGKLTIGIGRNIEDVGISVDEAKYLLKSDIKRCEIDLDNNLPWWSEKDENIKLVLIDMCFNLGISRLLKFKKFLSALQNDDFQKASIEMMDSAWSKQVGIRAKNLQKMVLRS